MTSVAIVNVTSYTGLELLRLLSQHPQFEVSSVTARSAVGKRLDDVFPQLRAMIHTNIDPNLIITQEPDQSELAFVCLPHAAAAETVLSLLDKGTKVVDLSADFRLRNVSLYEKWYQHEHPSPSMLETAVYGLCERYRSDIESASLIANPGCYATAAILGLLPALVTGSIQPDVIIDAKSGSSGAGRSLSLSTHFAELNEDISAYGLSGHRHLPEIIQELEAATQERDHPVHSLRVTFIPHLVPMTRGILATCYANLNEERISSTQEVHSLYHEFYQNEPFVHVIDQPPHTKWTLGSNHCLIYPTVDRYSQRLIVISCLDNLVKGAAGQAVQNANILFGIPETTALLAHPLYP